MRSGMLSLSLALWVGTIQAESPGKGQTNKQVPLAGLPSAPGPHLEKVKAPALAQIIDREIQQRLEAERVPAAPRADDAEFLRRAYLDIIGAVPPLEKAIGFLDSKDPGKRAKLVDELLASPQHARYLAGIWASKLIPRDPVTPRHHDRMVEALGPWFETAFQENKPWDRLVRELLTASGTDKDNPAVLIFDNPEIDKLTDVVGRLFLGVQLQCTQCHDDRLGRPWVRNDYWGMAAFFGKLKNNRVKPEEAAKNGLVAGFTEDPKVYRGSGPWLKLPATAKKVEPKFPGSEPARVDAAQPFRPILATWMTSPENPYFARAIVNRTWAHFFARGFVNPVDDMHRDNKPSHPKLLDELTAQFVANGFDLRYLVRAICASQAYHRTSKVSGSTPAKEAAFFNHMAVKSLTLRQLTNSRATVEGDKPRRGSGPKPQLYVNLIDETDPTEYSNGIPETLRMMNERGVEQLTSEVVGRLGRPPAGAPQENIEKLFLIALSRRPTAEESERLAAYVQRQSGRSSKPYQDIAWALLNSAEFLLNH